MTKICKSEMTDPVIARDFIENASLSLHCVTKDGLIAWANDTELTFLGYERDEYIGKPLKDFHVDEHVINDILERLGRFETLRDYPARLRHKNGSIKEVFINSNVYKEKGEFVHTRCFTRDISVLRSKERELEDKNRLLESIISNLGDGLVVSDEAGKFLYFNEAAEKILGIGADDIPKEKWIEKYGVYYPDKKTPYSTDKLPLVRALRGEASKDVELFISNPFLKKGAFLEVSGAPLKDRQGKLKGGVIVFKDITLRKKAQEELKKANEELEQFNRIAAHDLQEPLRTLISFSDLLRKDMGSQKIPEGAERDLNFIKLSAGRMHAIIKDLQQYARTKEPFIPEVVSLEDTVSEAVSILSNWVEDAGAEIKVGSLPQVMGNKSLLLILFQNFIKNAIRFRRDIPPKIHINGEKEEEFCVIHIEDNGIGIDPRYFEKIFIPFQRLHHNSEYKGTGVGLSICQRIIQQHEGEISLKSKLGKGSTFSFGLKLAL